MPRNQRPLLDLVDVVGGGTPSRSEPLYWGGDIPWASVKDLSGTTISDTVEYITRAGLDNSAANLVPAGAIVLATRIVPGRAALAKIDLAINQDLKGLLVEDRIEPAYLLQFIRSIAPRLTRMSSGSTVRGITLETLSRIRVPVPSVVEQRRLAGILDAADRIRVNGQAGFQLTEKLLRSTFVTLFGDPLRNEKGWDVVNLGDVASFVGGGTPSRAEPTFYGGEIAWASSKDISTDDLFDTQEHVTLDAVEKSATRVVSPGSILVVVKSKVLLHRLPVTITRIPVCFNQDIKAIQPFDDCLSVSFLARHLRLGQQALLQKARGANTEGLTLEHLRKYRVMMPPAQMLVRWDNIERAVAAMRDRMNAHQSRAISLFNALAQQVFDERDN